MQVLAGALKDNHRARIVGERTFGKGLIQTIVELSDGSGVAVTVARYQTPAGTDINKVRLCGHCCNFHDLYIVEQLSILYMACSRAMLPMPNAQ